MSTLDDVRFWEQVIGDARRTLVVNPDLESRAIEQLRARGLGHLVTVKASPYCPPEMAYLVDEQALAAALHTALARRVASPPPDVS